MNRFRTLVILILVFAEWNCAERNKKKFAEKKPKPLPQYKLAYSNQFGDFSSYRFTFDTLHNTIETVADFIDVLTRDYDIYRQFYDSTYQMTYEGNPFSHYYINKYCLNKDTFELCKKTTADTFPLPLIVELSTNSSRGYISPHSFDSYPTETVSDTSEKVPQYHYNPIQLSEISFLSNTSASAILADQSVDLNYDSIPERLVGYRTKDGFSHYAILEKQNQKWVMINILDIGLGENAGFSTLQMSGQKNRSVLLKVYSLGYVPRKRYFEDVFLFLPKE
jgi:hypothetical protein